MARRHGWLNDYLMQLDQGERVLPTHRVVAPEPQQQPVVVNITINLGDIISQLADKKMSTKEALTEALKGHTKRQALNE